MKTAKLVKDLSEDFRGEAKLYELSEPMTYGWDEDKTTAHVIVSAVVAMFSGPETYIFPASPDGEIIEYGEMAGSYRGGLCHEKALQNAGFALDNME